MGREIRKVGEDHTVKSTNDSSSVMYNEVRNERLRDGKADQKTELSPVDKASEETAKDVLKKLNAGDEKGASEELYQLWKKNQKSQKNDGDFESVVKNLEKSTKSSDLLHQVHFEKPYSSVQEVRVGLAAGLMTHKLFDLGDALQRSKAEDAASEAAKAPIFGNRFDQFNIIKQLNDASAAGSK